MAKIRLMFRVSECPVTSSAENAYGISCRKLSRGAKMSSVSFAMTRR